MYTGVKVFSASKHREREDLGDAATEWLQDNPSIEIVRTEVRQSSDQAYHCLSILFFYNNRKQR